jgi:hypothetical protein
MKNPPKPVYVIRDSGRAWSLPVGRFVSVLDFDATGWAPVTVTEASLIEEWGGDVVYTTMTQRQYWARREEALAARTVSACALDPEPKKEE